jgi:hypothetical protein
MTQLIQLTGNHYGITVPEGAQYYRLEYSANGEICELIFYRDCDDIDFPDEIDEFKIVDLPAGSWQLICMARDISEEMAKGIVTTGLNGLYKNYDTWIDMSGFEDYDKAVDSLRSLLASKGLNPETTLLIEKVG